jgi:hypothetical protein
MVSSLVAFANVHRNYYQWRHFPGKCSYRMLIHKMPLEDTCVDVKHACTPSQLHFLSPFMTVPSIQDLSYQWAIMTESPVGSGRVTVNHESDKPIA